MRVHTVSDIHVDYPANFTWIRSLSLDDYQDDILILAGDVCDNLQLLGDSFELLGQRFRKVCFVPGNHELWVKGSEFECSLEKFSAVKELCQLAGIITECHSEEAVSFVPLYSWYDYSFAAPDAYLKRAWRDYRSCSWPSHLQTSGDINRHFLALNTQLQPRCDKTVISFSHFVPRIDLMPSGIPEKRRSVYPVLGSESLGSQVQQLNPDLHVYGHSHVNQSKQLEGIHYVNNAFGYPSEMRIARKQLCCIYHDGQIQQAPLMNFSNRSD